METVREFKIVTPNEIRISHSNRTNQISFKDAIATILTEGGVVRFSNGLEITLVRKQGKIFVNYWINNFHVGQLKYEYNNFVEVFLK